MDFPYKPLHNDEIRLLRLLPSKDGDLACFELVHVSLHSKPTYTALSYTWGRPGYLYAVNIDSRKFPIRQNLHEALEQITSDWKRYIEDGGFLWVDAICINQDPLDPEALAERVSQVDIMTAIYVQAAQVLVWLGKPENEINNNMAFRLMARFVKRYRKILKDTKPLRPWWWKKPARNIGTDISDFILQLAPATDKDIFDIPGSNTYRAWLGIVALWQKPWWGRTWVFQEATVPEKYSITFISGIGALPYPSKGRFLCGTQECGWSEIDSAMVVASSILSTPGIPEHSRILVSKYEQLSKLLVFRSFRVKNMLGDFGLTLQLFRHTQCSDLRDKLYAPLCLAPEDARAFFKPDYQKDITEVYKDVARYFIQRKADPNLDFLGLTLHQSEEQIVSTSLLDGTSIRYELPSWVPNLAYNLTIHPISMRLIAPRYEPDRSPSPKFRDSNSLLDYNRPTASAYNPLSGTKGVIQPSIEGDRLYLRGAHIDNLKDIIRDKGSDLEQLKTIAREKGQQWSKESKYRYAPTDEQFTDALCRAHVLDILYNDDGIPSERGAKYDLAFMRKTKDELTVMDYAYQMNMKLARTNAYMHRDLGFTKKLYLAVIPNTAVVGDELWALETGRALYMLRAVDLEQKKYHFIGECYIHGLMDGEVSRLVSTGELSMEDIVLV